MEIWVFQKFTVTLPGCFIRRMQSAEGKLSIDERERKIQALKIKPLQEAFWFTYKDHGDENGIGPKRLKIRFWKFFGSDTPVYLHLIDSGKMIKAERCLGGWEECRCLPGFRWFTGRNWYLKGWNLVENRVLLLPQSSKECYNNNIS